MQRTKYWNQTRPTDTQLGWTETSKINAINERLRSSAQMGIAWGFQVSVNPVDNTKIDVARGEGYTGGMYLINEFETSGSGQRVSTYTDSPSGVDDTGPAATAQALSDYTAGVKNYISLVYDEVESYMLSERTFPFTNRETVVTETFTVSVLTETQWNALESAARNNRILVAIVTAKGAGVALTSADIDQFVQPKAHPSASNPSALVGVTVVGLAEVTPLGTATLRWDATTSRIYYTAPGDLEGAATTLTDSGSFVVYSNNTNYTITLNINFSSLSSVASQSENIAISSLYGRSIPMFSAVDQNHRDMLGSGQPTKTNPHALTVNDLGGGGFDHADLFHVNGISVDAVDTQLECQIDAINDRIQVTNLGGFQNSFLVDGNTWEVIYGVAAGNPGYESFAGLPADDPGDYLIYLDTNGALKRVKIAGYTEGAVPEWALWDTDIAIIDMHNEVAGNGTITWDDAAETLTYQAPGDGAAGTAVRLIGDTAGAGYWGYYKLFSSTTTNWVIVYVDGALGGANASTFSIVKDEITYPDETMLKLCVVNWTGGPLGIGSQMLTDLRDIRNYITADVKDSFEEEHTPEGYHTKPFRRALRVAHTSNVGVSIQVANSGLVGNADTAYGAVGIAETNGVAGVASNLGVYGYAATDTAGYFVAVESTAVYGNAGSIYGGYFEAPNSALYAEAATESAGIFVASRVAVYANATHNAVYASVDTDQAVIGIADEYRGVVGSAGSSLGVRGEAGVRWGVYATAPNTAVYGLAATATALMGTGPNVGIYGTAATETAILASAPNYGLVATADSARAVFGSADSTAANFVANANFAVSAVAAATGVYGYGVNYGVYGSAASAYGVAGAAGNLAGYFVASSDWAANNVIGLYGQAVNGVSADQAVGVEGYVGGNNATGIYGLANVATNGSGVFGSNPGSYGVGVAAIAMGVSGTGVYAEGTIGGLFSVPDPGGYPFSVVCSTNTIATMTVCSANVPIIINGTPYYFKVYTD
jgi:hypothetical protein